MAPLPHVWPNGHQKPKATECGHAGAKLRGKDLAGGHPVRRGEGCRARATVRGQ
jgi:hypothetical protein